ncbi:MAG: hypothetical protein HQL36_12755 [Alphaproteobacteria bacterium]|nr:hypothetical protein [Alphaproteobacteria bacterium]MBF0250432.1 hypothetical protein [Alphaproteobacteria bacterium]
MAARLKGWGDFQRWCRSRRLKALPAHAWTIAAYLRWVELRQGVEGARAALTAISREHLLRSARVPERLPTVQRTMALIERRAETHGDRAALFDERDVLADVPDAPDAPEPSGPPAEGRRWRPALTPRLVRRRGG